MTSPIKTIIAPLIPGAEDVIIAWSTRIARDFNATVDVAHLRRDERLSALLFGPDFTVSEAVVEEIRKGEREAEAAARARVEAAEDRGALGRFLSLSDAPDEGLARAARCYDLGVTLTLGDPASAPREELLGRLAVDAGIPVLAAPEELPATSPLDKPMIAWDGSREAGRALRAALPFLRRAKRIQIVHLGEGGAPRDPFGPALLYLEAHGVAVGATQLLRQSDLGEGATLLSLARSSEANLIVMGAYGHPRWMEQAFGGATHDVLRKSAVPVLLAH